MPVEQACKLLEGVKPRTLQRYVKKGLPHETRGRALWVDPDLVRAWMLEHEVDGKTRGTPIGGSADSQRAGWISVGGTLEGAPRPATASTPAASTSEPPVDVERLVRSRVDQELARATEQLREQLRGADLRKKNAEAEAKELAVAGKKGQLVDRAEVQAKGVAAVLLLKRSMEVMPAKLAARLVGRTREEIHEELAAEVDSLLRMFSEEIRKL